MEHLVSIRKSVKLKMKKETGLKYWELDIRQQALKLTANRFAFYGFTCAAIIANHRNLMFMFFYSF